MTKLSQIDPRNDSQIMFYDQIIPGSVLMGFLNADHWAVSVPVDRDNQFLRSTVVDKNAFPREVAMEAIIRFVDEDLASPCRITTTTLARNSTSELCH